MSLTRLGLYIAGASLVPGLAGCGQRGAAEAAQSASPRLAGVYLGRRYEGEITPFMQGRYVFARTAVNVDLRMRTEGDLRTWIVKQDGVERMVTSCFPAYLVADPPHSLDGLIAFQGGSRVPIKPALSHEGIDWYRPKDVEKVAVAKPGDWYRILKNAPVKWGKETVTVDWSACRPGTPCDDANRSADPEVLRIRDRGALLSPEVTPDAGLRLVGPKR